MNQMPRPLSFLCHKNKCHRINSVRTGNLVIFLQGKVPIPATLKATLVFDVSLVGEDDTVLTNTSISHV